MFYRFIKSFIFSLILTLSAFVFLPVSNLNAADCELNPPNFSWGTINATVNGTSVTIYNPGTTYAFRVQRSTVGCPPPEYNEAHTHQAGTVAYIQYKLDSGSYQNTGGWSLRGLAKPTACSYLCEQNEYEINFTLTGLSPGSHTITTRVQTQIGSTINNQYMKSVSFTICSAPTVNLKVNNSNGPITVNCGAGLDLSWTTTGATSCTASANPTDTDWSGSKSASGGTQTISAVNTNTTYSITCTGAGGSASDNLVVNVGNCAPTISLLAPANNTWLNYNPTFQAQVRDSNGNNVRANYFNVLDYGTYTSGYVSAGSTVSWGPINIASSCFQFYWNARAQDQPGLYSDWADYWLTKVDKTIPTAIIDQENGESDTSIWVNLTEADDCSGIAEGQVQVRINGGSWGTTGLPNNGSTINDFIYTATGASGQDIFSTAGTFTWTAPTNIFSVIAETWGGGGGGGCSDTTGKAGSGGGGGGYSKNSSITVVPGNNYSVVVGAGGTGSANGCGSKTNGGDSYFSSAATLLAKGGVAGGNNANPGGAGGLSSAGVGSTKYSGGTGGTGGSGGSGTAGGGGGGSSAGTGANGDNGDNGTSTNRGVGGTAPTNGGDGGNGNTAGNKGISATEVGGGGGGGGARLTSSSTKPGGGDGYQGKVAVNYSGSAIGSTYEFRYRTKDNAENWSDWAYDGSVIVIQNDAPDVNNLNISDINVCITPAYYFSFRYVDPNSDTESRFDFQVDNNSNFSSPEIDRSFNNLSNPSPTTNNQSVLLATSVLADHLLYNTHYYWRARVYDVHSAVSSWQSGTAFTTPLHHYPVIDFNWQPGYPFPQESTTFNSQSKCYDEDAINGANCSNTTLDDFSWDFDIIHKHGVEPDSSTLEQPVASFSERGTWTVELEVTDRNNLACSKQKTIQINYPLPRWREVKPTE